MLFYRDSGAWKYAKFYFKQGATWKEMSQVDVWGKLASDHQWHRGAPQEVVVTLDPPSLTYYWDTNLWEFLNHPTIPLHIIINVGTFAILGGSLHPTDPKAALELTGGWSLDTKFTVNLKGVLLGAAGYPALPNVEHPETYKISDKLDSFHAIASVDNSSSGVDSVLIDYRYGAHGPYTVIHPFFGTEYSNGSAWRTNGGVIYGQYWEGKAGGRGGDALRTNRSTVLNIQSSTVNGHDFIGAVLPGGGGGSSWPTIWRRAVFKYALYVATGSGAWESTTYEAQTSDVRQHTFAGPGGTAGFGAQWSAIQKQVNDASGIRFYEGARHYGSEPAGCYALGSFPKGFSRDGAPNYDTDGLYLHDNVAYLGIYPRTQPGGRFVSSFDSNRSAASGRRSGSDLLFGTPASIIAGAASAQDVISYADPSYVAELYTSGSHVSLSRVGLWGRIIDGALMLHDRNSNNGGTSSNVTDDQVTLACSLFTLGVGLGGSFGQPGKKPTTTHPTLASTTNKAFGYSFFVPSLTNVPVAPGGRAIVGSEYVTVNGTKYTSASSGGVYTRLANWAGDSVPFE